MDEKKGCSAFFPTLLVRSSQILRSGYRAVQTKSHFSPDPWSFISLQWLLWCEMNFIGVDNGTESDN